MRGGYLDVDSRAKLAIQKIPYGVEVSLERFLWESRVKESKLLYWLEKAERIGEVEIDQKKGILRRIDPKEVRG